MIRSGNCLLDYLFSKIEISSIVILGFVVINGCASSYRSVGNSADVKPWNRYVYTLKTVHNDGGEEYLYHSKVGLVETISRGEEKVFRIKAIRAVVFGFAIICQNPEEELDLKTTVKKNAEARSEPLDDFVRPMNRYVNRNLINLNPGETLDFSISHLEEDLQRELEEAIGRRHSNKINITVSLVFIEQNKSFKSN